MNEGLFEDLGEVLKIRIGYLHYVLLPVLVTVRVVLEGLEAVLSFKLLGQSHLDKAAHIPAELTVSVAHARKMDLRQLLYVWLQNVRILIDFVRVVRVIANTRSKGKLSDAVLSLLLWLLFLIRIALLIFFLWRWVVTL